jgi:1-acyl-sn-glycerol-3-phosphate acyltransferase
VGVFPEATMSPSLELLPFKQGAARMAIDADVPILPTILWGSQRVLGYAHRKPLLQRRLPITITDRRADGARLRTRVSPPPPAGCGVMTDMLYAAQDAYPDAPSDPGRLLVAPDPAGRHRTHPRGGPGDGQRPRRKRADET